MQGNRNRILDWNHIHTQVASQLHNPNGTTSDLNDGEKEVKTLHNGAIDRPPRCVGPFLISPPGEVVKAESRHSSVDEISPPMLSAPRLRRRSVRSRIRVRYAI